MQGPIVVVGGTSIVGSNRDLTSWETYHRSAAEGVVSRRIWTGHRFHRVVRLTGLELARLKDRLVVLVLVLKYHPENETMIE